MLELNPVQPIALTVGSLSYGRVSITEPSDVRRQAIAKLRGYP
ncbi:hypothetical protein U9R62_16445 [Cylindrospermopsis raciborskii DSH]|nr:hypothetical protein [Cylindrospermopsis raciborskii]